MYAHRAFRFDDEDAALAVASEYNFATLVTPSSSFASHLPIIVDRDRRVLRGHLARANPHTSAIGGADHLVVFTGPHAYISPDWYAANSPDVPTWNYVAVHVRGQGRVMERTEDVIAFLTELSAQEEARRHDLASGKVWTLDKTPEDKLRAMTQGIVAFEIKIEKIEAIAKLSQNKPVHVAAGVTEALQSGDDRRRAVAGSIQDTLDRRKPGS